MSGESSLRILAIPVNAVARVGLHSVNEASRYRQARVEMNRISKIAVNEEKSKDLTTENDILLDPDNA